MGALIAIVGPTAVGKSSLALSLAQSFNAEIVSSDSCQVYRYMDIGTAKPTREERAVVPHHLIDIVDPDDPFDLATYQKLAYSAINGIHGRGKPAILVGGSGLYVRAILSGYSIPDAPPDYELRARLQEKAKADGIDSIYDELKSIDAEAADKIDPRNVRRVIRAIEVYRTTGQPYSQTAKAVPPEYDMMTIGLNADRDQLYRRIDARVDSMMEAGLLDEVKKLTDRGYSLNLASMSSLGYKQIGQYLSGQTTLSEAVDKIKYETHRFARHQYSWFRLSDTGVKWFDISETVKDSTRDLVQRFLSQADLS